jgi:hypothetical protein
MLIKIIFWGRRLHCYKYQTDKDPEVEKRTTLYWSINRTDLGTTNPSCTTCRYFVTHLNMHLYAWSLCISLAHTYSPPPRSWTRCACVLTWIVLYHESSVGSSRSAQVLWDSKADRNKWRSLFVCGPLFLQVVWFIVMDKGAGWHN